MFWVEDGDGHDGFAGTEDEETFWVLEDHAHRRGGDGKANVANEHQDPYDQYWGERQGKAQVQEPSRCKQRLSIRPRRQRQRRKRPSQRNQGSNPPISRLRRPIVEHRTRNDDPRDNPSSAKVLLDLTTPASNINILK